MKRKNQSADCYAGCKHKNNNMVLEGKIQTV